MAFLEFKNVKIAGISAGVPKTVFCNLDMKDISGDYDAVAFVETTGIKERRFDERMTTSDLCCPAAERLIADLGWDKLEIEALIFVSQNTDYYEFLDNYRNNSESYFEIKNMFDKKEYSKYIDGLKSYMDSIDDAPKITIVTSKATDHRSLYKHNKNLKV